MEIDQEQPSAEPPTAMSRAVDRAVRGLRSAGRVAKACARAAAKTIVLLFFGGMGVFAALTLVIAVAAWRVTLDLPDWTTLVDGREQGSITVIDAEGAVIGVRGQRFRPLLADDASPALLDAVLSIEDRRYDWHMGVDPIGVIRAIVVNWRLGRTAQGGSTISQQVAKLAFLSRERTLSRKLREVPLALAMEWTYSKKELLSVYLNRVYLGEGAFGFEAAAQFYMGKSARHVTTAEAAVLAGLLRAPARWSPEHNIVGAKSRARIVLSAMQEAGRLSEEKHAAALRDLELWMPVLPYEAAPHFVDWVASEIPEDVKATGRDLVVRTSLDPNAQRAAEEAVRVGFHKRAEESERDLSGIEAAVLVTKPDGAVVAMIGGRDYVRSQFNRAASAQRQVGSAFKPVVYAAAFDAGRFPDDPVLDERVFMRGWAPRNHSGRYRGWIPMSEALAVSSNSVSVRLLLEAGTKRVVRTARALGVRGYVPNYPSIALGTVEASVVDVAGVYATIANRGRDARPWGVVEVRSRGGRVLWRRPDGNPKRILPTRHAGWLTALMRGVVENGTGRRARLEDRPSAGKTGTTQELKDAWYAGFTADYVGTVWIGTDDHERMRGVGRGGGHLPAEIWREAMTRLHDGLPARDLPEIMPPGLSFDPSAQEVTPSERALRPSERSTSRSRERLQRERRQVRQASRRDGFLRLPRASRNDDRGARRTTSQSNRSTRTRQSQRDFIDRDN